MTEAQKLFAKVQTELKRFSVTQLAAMMGYKSPTTVYKWLEKGKIPDSAIDNVKIYFREKV